MKAFLTLEKDPDEAYSECHKGKKLLAVIQSSDVKVVAHNLVIASQLPNNFMDACNYFSAQVSLLHGPAQLENCKYKRCNVSAMYDHGGRDSGCSGGHRHFGSHGRFGGCGGGSHSGGCGGHGRVVRV